MKGTKKHYRKITNEMNDTELWVEYLYVFIKVRLCNQQATTKAVYSFVVLLPLVTLALTQKEHHAFGPLRSGWVVLFFSMLAIFVTRKSRVATRAKNAHYVGTERRKKPR